MTERNQAILCVAIIALFIIGCFGFGYYNQHKDDNYFQKLNTPTEYTGQGYKVIFPCSDVKNTNLYSDSNYSYSWDSCEFFGGDDHNQIDTYKVFIKNYLTDNYNPKDESKCEGGVDEIDGTITNVIYKEKRTIGSTNIYICGQNSISAIENDTGVFATIINNNFVYRLQVTPSDKTTTYKKLNDFIASFSVL